MVDILKEYLTKSGLDLNAVTHVDNENGEIFAYRARYENIGMTVNFHLVGHFLVATVILDGWVQEDEEGLLLPCHFTPDQVNELREFLAMTNTHLLVNFLNYDQKYLTAKTYLDFNEDEPLSVKRIENMMEPLYRCMQVLKPLENVVKREIDFKTAYVIQKETWLRP